MAKVYVVNKGPHDYRDAEQYGELVYCTDGVIDKFDTAQMYREISGAMRDSEPDDYILLTSLATLCCVACGIFAAKHWQLNLLLYRGDSYIARSLFLDQR